MGKLPAYRKVLLCSSFCAALTWAMPSQAQVFANYDNNVVVDLSVLEDGGTSLERRSAANPFGEAQMPPAQMPRSRLLGIPDGVQTLAPLSQANNSVISEVPQSRLMVNPQGVSTASSNRIKLKKPSAPAKPQVGRSEVAQSAPKPMVKAPTKPVEVVKQVPPAPKAPPVKAEAPAPQPEKKVEVAEVAKPAPKPEAPAMKAPAETEVAQVEKKAEPAPEPKMPEPKMKEQQSATATPPPPPPPSSMEPKEVESALSETTTPKKDNATSRAALTTPEETSENNLRVSFDPGRSKLPTSAESDLQALATELKNRPDDRVQLQAYAGGDDLTASKARRLSLSRALAVRSFLIEQGVRSTRIDVRALGNKTTQEPFDRVDARITPR